MNYLKYLLSVVLLGTTHNTYAFTPTMSMKPMKKQHLIFFPARFRQPLPSEMYGNFLSKLKVNYDIHIASKSSQENEALILNIQSECSDYENIGFISHSSGVADLWNTYSSNTKINIGKIILIEPLDLQKNRAGFPSPFNYINDKLNDLDFDTISFNAINEKIEEMVETDYVEAFKMNIFGDFISNKKTKDIAEQNLESDDDDDSCLIDALETRGKLLVVKHKKSDKWRFVPTIPPLSTLRTDLVDFGKTMEIEEIAIDKFSHFDILDRPWANLLNRASLGENKSEEELQDYLNTIDNIILAFGDE